MSNLSVPGVPDGAVHVPKIVRVHLISAHKAQSCYVQWQGVEALVNVTDLTAGTGWTQVLRTKKARGLRGWECSHPKLWFR